MSKSRIDEARVRHVARLARLSLTDEEVEAMAVELDAILGHFEELDALDLDGVPATLHAVAADAPSRPDEPRPCLPRDEALAAAPEPLEGGFGVPRVVEGA